MSADLVASFFQIPLTKDSMRYCGISTPYKGIRVYRRCAMGMPGSETALEELMCRVLGELVQEGVVTKIADDLVIGGDTPEDLLQNWSCVLSHLSRATLCLNPAKTVVAPASTMILGWIWKNRTLRASPHHLSALATCEPLHTVKGLRSFLGGVKVLARVIPDIARYLAPLEDMPHGLDSASKLKWSDANIAQFRSVQKHLYKTKRITIPREEDKLWIAADASNTLQPSIASTLYLSRAGRMLLGGFFSAKLRPNKAAWLPCKIEALAIAASVQHHAPFITQSSSLRPS